LARSCNVGIVLMPQPASARQAIAKASERTKMRERGLVNASITASLNSERNRFGNGCIEGAIAKQGLLPDVGPALMQPQIYAQYCNWCGARFQLLPEWNKCQVYPQQ